MSFHLKITTNHSCPLLVSPLEFQIFFHERIHEPWAFFSSPHSTVLPYAVDP